MYIKSSAFNPHKSIPEAPSPFKRRLVLHTPSNYIILQTSYQDGWIISHSNPFNATAKVGDKWRLRTSANYKPYEGIVTLENKD